MVPEHSRGKPKRSILGERILDPSESNEGISFPRILWMLPLFLMVIPVAWARMELKSHDLKQIAAGAVLSTMLTWIQMSFYVHHVF